MTDYQDHTITVPTREYSKDGYDYRLYSFNLAGLHVLCRESHDYEAGWHNEAVISGPDLPTIPECQGDGCSYRHPCDPCYAWDEWSSKICSTVSSLTGWSLGDYYSGPGRRFAHAPTVSLKGSRIKVSWSGGLDI